MQSIQFPNLGYVKDTITNQQIPNLLAWIDAIDANTTPINHSHVGVIEREYEIVEEGAKAELSNILSPMVQQYATDMHFTIEPRPLF